MAGLVDVPTLIWHPTIDVAVVVPVVVVDLDEADAALSQAPRHEGGIGESAGLPGFFAVEFVGVFRFVGDPIDNMLGQERTIEDVERLRTQLGLDQPFPVQYYKFLEGAIQGNFGVGYRQGRPVADILMERAPATLELAAVSGLLAIAFGIALGVFTAIRRNGVAAHTIMAASLIGVSLPTFLIGILLIYLFLYFSVLLRYIQIGRDYAHIDYDKIYYYKKLYKP